MAGRKQGRPGQRPGRVGEQIRQILGELAMSGAIKEAGLDAANLVSFTEVRVTADLRIARVFVSIFPSDPEVVKTVMTALEDAKPRIRAMVAKEARLRHTPELVLTHDASIETGARMEALLREVREEDEALRGDVSPEPSDEES